MMANELVELAAQPRRRDARGNLIQLEGQHVHCNLLAKGDVSSGTRVDAGHVSVEPTATAQLREYGEAEELRQKVRCQVWVLGQR